MSLCRFFTGGLAAAGMLVLILDGQTARNGASAAIALCIKTVIPSLFPFLFLCALLTDSLWGTSLPFQRICRRVGIPTGGESLLIPALLGGYPAGAQVIAEAYREGRLTRQDASHLLRFCSNAGPAFLFGMITLQFQNQKYIWALWGIQILSALFTGMVSRQVASSAVSFSIKSKSVSQILLNTVRTMGTICGWIILFQILLSFLARWIFWRLPDPLPVVVSGLLELSIGCCQLSDIDNEAMRFLICSALLSFGGLCVIMQTASVIGNLSCRNYLTGKLIQTLFCIILSAAFLRFGWSGLLVAGTLFFLFPIASQKTGRFPALSDV